MVSLPPAGLCLAVPSLPLAHAAIARARHDQAPSHGIVILPCSHTSATSAFRSQVSRNRPSYRICA